MLSKLEDNLDLAAFSVTSKGMQAVASDAVLVAQWLFKHREQKAVPIAAHFGAKREDIMLQLLQNCGASATAAPYYYNRRLGYGSFSTPHLWS